MTTPRPAPFGHPKGVSVAHRTSASGRKYADSLQPRLVALRKKRARTRRVFPWRDRSGLWQTGVDGGGRCLLRDL